MKALKFWLYSLILVLSVSCSSFKDLTFGPIQDVKVLKFEQGTLQVALNVTIDNPNSSDLKVKNTDLIVTNGTKMMGKIKQIENLVIEGKTKKVYTIPLSVEITDSSAPFASALSFLSGKKPDIRIKGKLSAGAFLFTRTIEIDQPIPLNF
jgi:LEA14-like dessication related protein